MDAGAVAVMIPIVAIVSAAGVKVAKIMAQTRGLGPDPDTQARLASLEDVVETLRRELDEAHERIEFAERLLAQPRPDKLGPPPQ